MRLQVKLLALFLSLSFYTHAVNISDMLRIIKHVESRGNTEIIGDNGKAYGVLQIHKICVDDVNRIYGTDYTHQDAFNEQCSNEIFELYINHGVKLYIKKYNRRPSEQDIVRMWNGSIYNGYNKESTIKYYDKYLVFKLLYRKKCRCRD